MAVNILIHCDFIIFKSLENIFFNRISRSRFFFVEKINGEKKTLANKRKFND